MTQPQAAITTGFADVPGGKLYYEIAGQGHPLVLIHAGVADCRMWDDQFQAFAHYYRVIRYDLRGYGRTQSEETSFAHHRDLFDLLTYLGIERAHLLGLSIGGQIATDFTLDHAEMVTALVLVASGLSGYQWTPGQDAKSQSEISKFAEMDTLWQSKDYERLSELELQMWVDGPVQPNGRVAEPVRTRVREMNALAYSHLMARTNTVESEPLTPPAIERLDEIRVPTLVMVGDLDTTGILERCAVLTHGIKGAQQVMIHDAAHMVNMEKPAEFNRIVLDFLRGL